MHQMHPGRQQWAGFCTIMLLGDRITSRYDLRFQRSSDFIAYAHEWPVFFLFGDRRTHLSRTTEFRVGPAPELRRVITQLRRFFSATCLSRVQTIWDKDREGYRTHS